MKCPRCGNEWDVSKTPCSYCGLLVRLPGRSGTRSTTPSAQGNTQSYQNSRSSQVFQSGSIPPIKQQSGSTPPIEQPLHEPVPSPSTRMPVLPITPLPFSEMEHKLRGNVQESLQPWPQQQQENRELTSSESSTFSTSRSASSPSLNYNSDPFLSRLQKSETQVEQSLTQNNGAFDRDNPSQRSVPSHPQARLPLQNLRENVLRDAQRPIRSSRLVTDPLFKEKQQSSFMPLPSSGRFTPPSSVGSSHLKMPLLSPGALLRGGRYRLSELQDHQDWLDGVFEAMWIAQDAHRSGAQVMISELVTPDSKSMMVQSTTLRTATMALTSVGRHPHIPTLWDAFSTQGRGFFVFEPAEGESLVARIRRTGRALSEQEVIECCLQMTEILEILSQQSPPLVHGLIRPEHIVVRYSGSDYVLTNFSILLAGGATEFVAGIDRSRVSPYTANEFIRGEIDVRSDLYSLVATAYYAATGRIPASVGGSIPQAQRLNPAISSELDAILTRGLRPTANQRYQRPSELRQDLLSIRSVSSTLFSNNESPSRPGSQQTERASITQGPPSQNLLSQSQASVSESVSQILPGLLAPTVVNAPDRSRQLLPRPEELPPMPEHNNSQQATFWLIGILICLIVVVILSRGLL